MFVTASPLVPGSALVTSGSELPNWYVCHCRPRCEKKLAARLAAEGITHELPLYTSVRRYRDYTKRYTKPLFPGYVFTHATQEQRSIVRVQDTLARLYPIEDQTRFVAQLDTVRKLVCSGLEINQHALLTKGTRVRVTGGAFHGIEGIIANPDDPRGIVIAMDVLQQGVLVRFPPDQLERVG